jgi:uncharacterized protein (TIGR02996 family)
VKAGSDRWYRSAVLPDEPVNVELLDALRREPWNPGAHAVYADWLTEQGQPRGELIAVQLAAAQERTDALTDRERALVRAIESSFSGVERLRTLLTWRWHLGFVRSVTLDLRQDRKDAVDVVAPFFRLPAAALIDGVRVLGAAPPPVMQVVAEHVGGTVISIAQEGDAMGSASVVGALGGFPRLESLVLRQCVVQGPAGKLPAELLSLRLDRVTGGGFVLQSLSRGHPKLRQLSIADDRRRAFWHPEAHYGEEINIRAHLFGRALPALEELELADSDALWLLRAACDVKRIARLKRLTLRLSPDQVDEMNELMYRLRGPQVTIYLPDRSRGVTAPLPNVRVVYGG